ncbi:MAG TPA: sensor histidine kinase [Acidimicrobiia bacterium]|jgi:signal transduction histidine kinase
MSSGAAPSRERSGWERGLDLAAAYGPLVTLAVGTAFAFAVPNETSPFLIAGLVALAASWVYFVYPRGALDRQGRLRVYYLGYMVLAVVLISLHPFFFIFPVAAFFQAYLLKPPPVTFAAVLLASLVVNSLIVRDAPTTQNWWIFAVVVAIQTLAIGVGVIGGEKINELSEARRRAVAELERALEENEGLHAQLMIQAREAGVADERERLAREIHDTIAQGLVGVITQLEAAEHVIADRAALERHLQNATRLARESLLEARRAVRGAAPLQLEGRTLPQAIAEVVEKWSSVNEVAVEWASTGDPVDLHPEIEVTLLRAVQESLANVARHSAASRVGVTLSYMGDLVAVDVRDDGRGFSPNGGDTTGYGLRAMRTRVEQLEGTFEIESAPGHGTAVCVCLPTGGVGDG